MNKTMSLFQFPSQDESDFWNKKAEWLKYDYLDSKISDYIMPHHYEYYSGLNSLFLYNIKDIENLNFFETILVRDGSLTLFKFFHSNPEPKHIKTTLLINKNLFYLVPSAWKNQVLLYEIKSRLKSPKNPKGLFIFGNIDSNHCSIDYLEQVLSKTLNQCQIKENNVPIFNTLIINELNNERKVEKENKFIFEMISKLARISGAENSYLTWQDLQELNFQDCLFLDLNQFDHLYSDSYVEYFFLSRGAYPIPRIEKHGDVQTVDLSPSHYINIFGEFPSIYEEASHKIHSELEFYNQNILNEEFSLNRKVDYFSDVKICTTDLINYSNHLAKKYHPCSLKRDS